jgi:hypothetical protein
MKVWDGVSKGRLMSYGGLGNKERVRVYVPCRAPTREGLPGLSKYENLTDKARHVAGFRSCRRPDKMCLAAGTPSTRG